MAIIINHQHDRPINHLTQNTIAQSITQKCDRPIIHKNTIAQSSTSLNEKGFKWIDFE
ncbi:MAG: hypothetical protein ACK5RE_12505 [Pseudanabaena sp.]